MRRTQPAKGCASSASHQQDSLLARTLSPAILFWFREPNFAHLLAIRSKALLSLVAIDLEALLLDWFELFCGDRPR